MKNLIRDKKIIIIWLWKQWIKIINFLKKEHCDNNIIWVCRTLWTSKIIKQTHTIPVYTDYKKVIKRYNSNISCIFLCVKPKEIQEQIYLDIHWILPECKIIIEKSFISEKGLDIINNTIPYTLIIQNEIWSSNFYKEFIPGKSKYIESIKLYIIPSYNIFNDIIDGKVFLFSYLFDYLWFLPMDNLKLLKSEKLPEKNIIKISMLLREIHIDIIMVNKNIDICKDICIYNLKGNWRAIFQRGADYSYIENVPIKNNNILDGCYETFLKDKVPLLFSNNMSSKDQIESIKKFRKLNTLHKHICL